jgi:hypothetical protein
MNKIVNLCVEHYSSSSIIGFHRTLHKEINTHLESNIRKFFLKSHVFAVPSLDLNYAKNALGMPTFLENVLS